MGDLADDDRGHGMGIVVEYAGHQGKSVWIPPKPFHWDYLRLAKGGATAVSPDETFEMRFVKDNAAEEGFNRWTINGVAYPMTEGVVPAPFHLKQGGRYRIRMRNASDDIHPIHLHRHSFELTKLAGKPTAGVMKDVVMVGGYQKWILRRTIPDLRCSTAISSYTWTLASWRTPPRQLRKACISQVSSNC
jgi:FtsP/CotA-like multicopper oxidase with cupredoxin domain